ncbi:putative Filamentous hemagglutinin N-terminal domain-containing protein [Gammaproteobacteria bacterium]
MHRYFFPAILLLPLILPVRAGVVLDGTLGLSGALSGPNYAIGANQGQQRGANLFHSFQTFSLAGNESATFSGPAGIQNVIARVTGSDPSSIDGMLRSTMPGANFYFLNPHGVLFGPHATLDIQGSFYASTAQTLRFADGKEFSAAHPAASIISAAPPEAFGFLEQNPAAVTCNSCKLNVPEGKTLELVAGQIRVQGDPGQMGVPGDPADGPPWPAKLNAKNGGITLVATIKPGDIPVDVANIFSKDPANGRPDGPITLLNANLNVGNPPPPPPGGGGPPSPPPPGGSRQSTPPDQANGVILMGGTVDLIGSEITNHAHDLDGLTIRIVAQDLWLHGENSTHPPDNHGSTLFANTDGSGRGGPIILDVPGNLILDNKAFISTDSEGTLSNAGGAGNINISAGHLQVLGVSLIDSSTRGPGPAGNVSMTADQLLVSGHEANGRGSHVFSAVWDDPGHPGVGTGSGGSIKINTPELILRDGGSISTETHDPGHAGRIEITAGAVLVDGWSEDGAKQSAIFANSEAMDHPGSPSGNAGSIRLDARTLTLINGGSIKSTTDNVGLGGDINIKLSGDLVVKGDLFHRMSEGPLAGQWVTTPSAITSQSGPPAAPNAGNAGSIEITTQNLEVRDGATINTSALNAGGGGITLKVQNRAYLLDGQITTSVFTGTGQGGSITIDNTPDSQSVPLDHGQFAGPQSVVLNRSQITTYAWDGKGGDITIKADTILISATSLIDPLSHHGGAKLNGTIRLESPNQMTNGSVVPLPSDYLAIDQQLSRNCKPRERGSQLLVRPARSCGDVVNDWTYQSW